MPNHMKQMDGEFQRKIKRGGEPFRIKKFPLTETPARTDKTIPINNLRKMSPASKCAMLTKKMNMGRYARKKLAAQQSRC